MKRAVLNAVILCALTLSVLAIIRPLAAEVQFNAGKFRQAIKIDPSNSEYPAALADLLSREAPSSERRIEYLDEAEGLYKKAISLNPVNALYAAGAGRVQMQLFLTDKVRFKKNFEEGWRYFKSAFENDPYGFNASYIIGYAGVNFWGLLNEEEKKFVLDRMRASLEARPYYAAYVYEKLWRHLRDFEALRYVTPNTVESNQYLYDFVTRSNLWRFRKKAAAGLEMYKKAQDPKGFLKEREEAREYINSLKMDHGKRNPLEPATVFAPKAGWKGKAQYLPETIKDGMMFWTGKVYMVVNMKPGTAYIVIDAKKLLAIKTDDPGNAKFYPYMIVRLDDEVIGETYVANSEWKSYLFPANTKGGLKVLTVEFANDIYDPVKGDDRNLAVGDVSISYGKI